jgi:hypothetical protein
MIAAESIGDGYRFIDKATFHAGVRDVFGRPTGQHQGLQVPPTGLSALPRPMPPAPWPESRRQRDE